MVPNVDVSTSVNRELKRTLLLNFYLLFFVHDACLSLCICMCMPLHICGSKRTTCKSWFFPSAM